MADVVTVQTIINGPRNLVVKCTDFSDGTGEAGIKKVDAQSATFANNGIVPGIHLSLWMIEYDLANLSLRIQWDATIPVDMLMLGGFGRLPFFRFGGLVNPQAAGATGSILFTTVGQSAGSGYSVVLHMKKNV